MIQDSAPTVVASMLVSPLMGPIVGLTFGIISRDQNIMYLSARSELVVCVTLRSSAVYVSRCIHTCYSCPFYFATQGIVVCLVVGVGVGCCALPFWGQIAWPTNEILSRGTLEGLYWGFFVAVPSGCVFIPLAFVHRWYRY
jgi:hypothetical protein